MFGYRTLFNRWRHVIAEDLTIAASAKIDSFVKLGKNNYIFEGARLFGSVNTGKNVTVADDAMLYGEMQIGDRTYIGCGTKICNFTGPETSIEIGKYCSLGPNVILYANTHHDTLPSTAFLVQADSNFTWAKKNGITRIGNDVWIGAHAFLSPGITVGDGAIIAAGAVVVHDVSPYEIIGGAPAKKIRMRFAEDVISELLKIKWWDWNDAKLKANAEFFTSALKSATDIKIK